MELEVTLTLDNIPQIMNLSPPPSPLLRPIEDPNENISFLQLSANSSFQSIPSIPTFNGDVMDEVPK